MLNNKLDTTFGVNLAGHVTGDFGLAEAARGTLRAMEAARIPFKIMDLKVGGQPNSLSHQYYPNKSQLGRADFGGILPRYWQRIFSR
jgi:hypothetical protein